MSLVSLRKFLFLMYLSADPFGELFCCRLGTSPKALGLVSTRFTMLPSRTSGRSPNIEALVMSKSQFSKICTHKMKVKA